jgi:hypothetical protein
MVEKTRSSLELLDDEINDLLVLRLELENHNLNDCDEKDKHVIRIERAGYNIFKTCVACGFSISEDCLNFERY